MSHTFDQEELEIALNLPSNIEAKQLLSRNLASIDRIVNIYFQQNNRKMDDEKQVFDFLFQYLSVHGRDASILFQHIKKSPLLNDTINRLHSDYQDKFNFDIINSSLFESLFDLLKNNEYMKNYFIICLFLLPFLLFLSFLFFTKNNEKQKTINKYTKLNKQLEIQLNNVNRQLENEISLKKQIESSNNINKAIQKYFKTELPSIQNQLKKEINSIQSKFDTEITNIKDQLKKQINENINQTNGNTNQTNGNTNQTNENINQTIISNNYNPKKQKSFKIDNVSQVYVFFIDIIIEFLIFFLYDGYFNDEIKIAFFCQIALSVLFWIQYAVIITISLSIMTVLFAGIILNIYRITYNHEEGLVFASIYYFVISIIKFTFMIPNYWSSEINRFISVIFSIGIIINAYLLLDYVLSDRKNDRLKEVYIVAFQTLFYFLSLNKEKLLFPIMTVALIWIMLLISINLLDDGDHVFCVILLNISNIIKYFYFIVNSRSNFMNNLMVILFIISVFSLILADIYKDKLSTLIIFEVVTCLLGYFKKYAANCLFLVALIAFMVILVLVFMEEHKFRYALFAGISLINYHLFIAQMGQ